MSLDLRLMRYVIAVAETGGFQAAAERLHIAQPPLSRQIRQLEGELGVALFERRPTRLTGAGQVFVDAARETLAAAERTVAVTRRAARTATGTLRVGYGPTTAHSEMPLLLAALAEAHPEVTVEAVESWDPGLVDGLRTGGLDAALGRHLPTPRDCRALTLRAEEYVAVVHAGHRYAGRGAVALRDLRGETFRFLARDLAPDYHDAVLAAARSTGEDFAVWHNPVPGLRNHLGVLTDGFMLLPRSVAEHLLPAAARLTLTDPLPPVPLRLVHRGARDAPALAALVRTARALSAAEGWTAGTSPDAGSDA
ncbi:LysR substrate-binding domain-containing protein [Streptomyces aculeolatus]|uniref:LysR family transcriptional regulator n=1 Tax=Streptomyces aculeolatus TaxID=270689 RepID=UPI001CEC04B2|nr:LysR substrate-binding domain-containing protein [Streptomyces aculeolatus]